MFTERELAIISMALDEYSYALSSDTESRKAYLVEVKELEKKVKDIKITLDK